jgi:hypothetical protein
MKVVFQATREGNLVQNFFEVGKLSSTGLQDDDGVISILDHRERRVTIVGEGWQQVPISVFMIDETLQEINCNSKQKRGEGFTLPNTFFTTKFFASSAIQEN